MARVPPTELAFAHAVQHLAYAYVTRGIQSTCRSVGAGFPGLGGAPLDAAQTVYFTIYYQLSRVSEELPETARHCSDRVFYNILSTFPGLGGAPGDRSMLLRPCILQYIINFPRTWRSSGRPLDAAQTVYFTIHY